ncbi:hypothetical protein HZA99_05730 [Candidatus Woesearchaeota archaeon]|nr:hypothetical protein [Candidatus Woesearchaeota archaeon]
MAFSLKDELESVAKDIKWNFKGILDTEGRLHEIPKNLNFQALFEKLVSERLGILTKKHKITVIENRSIRSYPDVVLTGGELGKKVIALDIKTGRRKNDRTAFTLGSYKKYLRNPAKPLCFGGKYCYQDFSEHWVVCFIYDWNSDADTLNMISNIEVIVQEKWKIASKTTGTGTTTAIGSINKIEDMRRGEGDFKTEDEFLIYWRAFSRRNEK